MLFIVSLYLSWLHSYFHRLVLRVWRDEEGASLVEYAILVALIAIVAIAAVQALGNGITGVFQNILGRIQGLGR
ncbi:MAG: Flp family type IVb pilin [Anaerolineae bacterium]